MIALPRWIQIGGALLGIASAPAAPAGAQSSPAPLDPREVEAWIDHQVEPALRTSGIPGALVVVARRDTVVLNKGYGVADRAAGTAVDPAVTLFQTASIGKTMTAMLVAQLVDEGGLDLDRDVNRYLTSARIAGPTVTLRMLLAHRGGFDDDITGLLVPFDADIRMSRGELDRRLHPLVRPGFVTAYDNQGFGVIGLILRDVTGQSLPTLYRDRLFGPAGMAGAVQGRPPDGRARLAHCYTVQGPGRVQQCESWLYREGFMGAGGVLATGADMARYLRLLLNGGTLDGRVVLTPRAFANLTDFEHFRFRPGMPGGGLAFVQFEEHRGLEYAHSGSIPGFSSMMKIYPDADVGIFVCFLGGQPGGFDLTVSNVFRSLRQVSIRPEARPGLRTLQELTDAFANRFIPADRPSTSEPPGGLGPPQPGAAAPFLGWYVIGSNHSRSFFARLAGWGDLIHLTRGEGEALRLGGAYAALGDYRPVGPLVYQNDKGDRLALAESPVGRLMAIGLSGGVFRKTNLLASPIWALPAFGLALLLELTGLVQLRRRAPGWVRRVGALGVIGSVSVLAALLAEWQWGVMLGVVRGAIMLPAVWRLALHVGAGLLLWQTVVVLRARGSKAGWLVRTHAVVLATAGMALVVALAAWRVLGAFPPYFTW